MHISSFNDKHGLLLNTGLNLSKSCGLNAGNSSKINGYCSRIALVINPGLKIVV